MGTSSGRLGLRRGHTHTIMAVAAVANVLLSPCSAIAKNPPAPSVQQRKGTTTQRQEKPAEARVQEVWQSAFINHLAQTKGKKLEAWALFSYGGWSDRGQYFFVKTEGSHSAYFVPQNYQHVRAKKKNPQSHVWPTRVKGSSEAWTLSPQGWQQFRRPPIAATQWQQLEEVFAKFMKLSDYRPHVFDGLQLEFIHVTGKNGQVQVDTRVFINTPSEDQAPLHNAAVEEFFKLVEKPAPASK